MRSGAANPWARDPAWARAAYNASHSNLQALRELDSTGESFLRAGGASAAALVGPLVLASPDPSGPPRVLASAAAAEEEEGQLSDASSESTVLAGRGAAAHRLGAAAGAAAGPRPAPPPPLAAAAPARSSLALPGQAPAAARPAGGRSCSKQHTLEPFSCSISYYGLPA